MSLIKFNPRERDVFADLFNMQKDMNRMLTNFWGNDADLGSVQGWYPAVDVAETKDEFQVKVEVPGMNKDDLKIKLQENVLTVQGEKKQETETKEQNYHRMERSYGSFCRSFRLPSLVKADKIDANYKDGVLSIKLPKAEEAKTKEIEIKF
jgi:HSP20 family protein